MIRYGSRPLITIYYSYSFTFYSHINLYLLPSLSYSSFVFILSSDNFKSYEMHWIICTPPPHTLPVAFLCGLFQTSQFHTAYATDRYSGQATVIMSRVQWNFFWKTTGEMSPNVPVASYCFVFYIVGCWEFFSKKPPRPERLWGPPSLLSNGYQRLFPGD
jgi:hypothetical protein